MPRNAREARRWRGNRWRIAGWGSAAALLLLPAVAMQVTDAVAWDLADFVVAGALVAGAGIVCELAAMRTGNGAYRAAVGVAVTAAVMLVWINLAVGIIGSEDNPANLIYGGVLAVGIAGAVVARSRPKGMARALIATALAQAAAALVAFAAGWGATWPIDVIFAALWLISAWLFSRAARQPAPVGAAR